MDRAGFLDRVEIDNFKSIVRCDARLGALRYLVGPNGAGKSNFIDAIRFVADCLTVSVPQALRVRGGGEAICHAATAMQGWFRIRLSGEGWSAALRLERDRAGAWRAVEQELPDDRSGLESMRFYSIQPRSVEDVADFVPLEFLRSDGANLANVVWRLRQDERINEYLRALVPGLVRARAEPVSAAGLETARKVSLLFEQRISGPNVRLFWPSQMSDGSVGALAVLAALAQARGEPRPSLLALEEPEAHIHPPAMGVLRDAANEASASSQVLIATHGADILDDKEVLPDEILAVSAAEGETRIGPMDEGAADLIRKGVYTPGELLRLGQLFPAGARP